MIMRDEDIIEEMAKATWEQRRATFHAMNCRPLPKWHEERGDAKAAVRAEARAAFECDAVKALRDYAWRYYEMVAE